MTVGSRKTGDNNGRRILLLLAASLCLGTLVGVSRSSGDAVVFEFNAGAHAHQRTDADRCEETQDIAAYCECAKASTGLRDAVAQQFTLVDAQVDEALFKVNIYSNDDIVSGAIAEYKMWEPETSRMLVQAMDEHYERLKAKNPDIQKKDVKFLDIGANIGWYSLLIAMQGYGVISVEPMQSNLLGYKNSICENGLEHLVVIHETALSAEPKVCRLFSITSNVGDGTIACETDWTSSHPEHPTYVFRQNVTFSRLDDLIPDTETIGVVKMDVEGYEPHVVAGGQQTLLFGGVPKILSEFGPWLMKDARADPVEFLEVFHDAGYIVRRDSFDSGQILSTKDDFEQLEQTTEIGATFFEKLP